MRDTPCKEMTKSEQKCPEISCYKHTYIRTLCSEHSKGVSIVSRVMKGSLFYQGVLVLVLQVSVQCLPLTEGGTKSVGQWGHWVLCPPRQQHSLRFAEVAKNVRSSWPLSVLRVPV